MFENRRAERRLQRIEYKLDLIMRHLGITDSPAPLRDSPTRPMPGSVSGADMAAIDALITQGKKIQAIKLYREMLPGTSLKDAKDAIEARERPTY
ncbi:hypothetical protein [Nocardia macrotermitis]|uniref:Ribosomal protein L7/L12 C-terminal domain-containing protein n=1 Tax=Nocardia macrotermitis TaxID=2585198 RepID=A0A7K0DCZ7_9NOCA|nr:hypothetical protein [Nocardia macrotermitis]MQY23391.1 hypothetical protein [Nocardia macrotermitis]